MGPSVREQVREGRRRRWWWLLRGKRAHSKGGGIGRTSVPTKMAMTCAKSTKMLPVSGTQGR